MVQWQLDVVVFVCLCLDASLSLLCVLSLSDTVCGITSSSYPITTTMMEKKRFSDMSNAATPLETQNDFSTNIS